MTAPELATVRRLIFDAVAVSVLRKVVAAAAEASACVAPIKGVVLSRWLYGEVAERPYRDVDILIARADLVQMRAAVVANDWPIKVYSVEMGELEFTVDRLTVEMHGELGRRDLSRMTASDVLSRAVFDDTSFPFRVNRIDDIDHLFLLVANVIKKSFTYANAHQPADLNRLLGRLRPRWGELIARAQAARFVTAVRAVSEWMADERQSVVFAEFAGILPQSRRVLPAVVRWYRHRDRRRPDRLKSATGLLGLALATQTPDDFRLRARGLSRLIRRGLVRRVGGNPG
ncbi:MAG: nucleotidyltransferase family protein [Polyangia bacterium]